ncbi:MAG: hypothetical protein J7K54_02640 [Candidatus Aenigmarchaeota archaeon]|nr:hypothetical protein [Candidatus Aenigmarchaeota archaeon]
MGLFETMVQNMQRMEFFQYLFPFLLSFALLYGLLQWVFKEGLGGKRVHTLIAIVLSFFVMLYSSYNPWLYTFLTTTSGVWLGFATVVLLLVLVLALLGINLHDLFGDKKNNWIKYLVVLIVIYLVLMAILGQGGLFSAYLPYWLTGSDLWTVIFVIVIIAIIFWFVGGSDTGGSSGGEKPSE